MSLFDDLFRDLASPALVDEFGELVVYRQYPDPNNPPVQTAVTAIVGRDLEEIRGLRPTGLQRSGRRPIIVTVKVPKSSIAEVVPGSDEVYIESDDRTFRVDQILSEDSAHFEVICQ